VLLPNGRRVGRAARVPRRPHAKQSVRSGSGSGGCGRLVKSKSYERSVASLSRSVNKESPQLVSMNRRTCVVMTSLSEGITEAFHPKAWEFTDLSGTATTSPTAVGPCLSRPPRKPTGWPGCIRLDPTRPLRAIAS
jgi:hypothetical protein